MCPKSFLKVRFCREFYSIWNVLKTIFVTWKNLWRIQILNSQMTTTPTTTGAVVVVFEFNIWIIHRFFFGRVPKLFSKLDFGREFYYIWNVLKIIFVTWKNPWRIQILNSQITATTPTTTGLSCQRKRSP